ncbi:MAG: DUF551 domain-containing protein [Prevotellaceae bacterium]|jgi:hypothetical protein|nr:DUF551 domain-containing protein [Prevotellaceae bacterium]
MKTIKQSGEAYINSTYHNSDDKSNFDRAMRIYQAGIQTAQEWISVDSELPEIGVIILMKNKDNDYSTGSLHSDGFAPDFPLNGEITHWRPIERK